MKKKLLTVLLAVVMVFGVFGLTACGGSNADADYNYYGVKYELEDEVKIQAATFQGVYKMFTTAGYFLLYVESGEDKEDFQKINKLANDWGVTIYHFNPDLTGGYASDDKNAVGGNLLTLSETAYNSQMGSIQDLLVSIANVSSISALKDGNLWAIQGAESTVSNGALKYNGKVLAQNPADAGAKSIVAACRVGGATNGQRPSYGAATEDEKDIPEVPEAYNTAVIKTMNLFGDARLHMYDDRDAIIEEKTDVYVTVANYEMFAHLLDYNEGYFSVFFGGTWCPNTQAIAKATNDLAKAYGIEKIYFFDPRLDDGVRLDVVSSSTVFSADKLAEDELKAEKLYAEYMTETDPVKKAAIEEEMEALAATAGYTTTYSVTENSGNITGNLNTRNNDASTASKWSGLNDYNKAIEVAKQAKFTEKNAGFKDEAPVDVWTEAYSKAKIAEIEAAIVTKAGTLNAKYETEAKKAIKKSEWDEMTAYEKAEKIIAEYNKDSANASSKIDIAKEKGKLLVDGIKAAITAGEVDKAAADTVDQAYAKLQAAAEKAYNKANKTSYNYNFTYGTFLRDYLNTYWSEWNITASLTITVDGETDTYTRMCVPNIMMFDGSKADAKAELIALAEAEYNWPGTNTDGHPQKDSWETAVKGVFDANPYATYTAPVAETPAADASAGAAGGAASAPAASAGAAAEAC